jgi:hypothetical protein
VARVRLPRVRSVESVLVAPAEPGEQPV